jgi:hypothetical protein
MTCTMVLAVVLATAFQTLVVRRKSIPGNLAVN